MQDVGLLGRAGVGMGAAQVGAQLALEFQQQALGGFLADAGHLDQAAGFLRRDRLCQLLHAQPAQYAQRHARAHARHLDELAKGVALRRGGKTIEQLCILAHDKMRQQSDRLAQAGQMVESAHGHIHLVAHAVAVDQHLGRVFGGQGALESSDHGVPSKEYFSKMIAGSALCICAGACFGYGLP